MPGGAARGKSSPRDDPGDAAKDIADAVLVGALTPSVARTPIAAASWYVVTKSGIVLRRQRAGCPCRERARLWLLRRCHGDRLGRVGGLAARTLEHVRRRAQPGERCEERCCSAGAGHMVEPSASCTRIALRGFSVRLPAAGAAAIARSPAVAYVEADQVYTVTAQSMPTAIQRVFAPDNPAIASVGAGVDQSARTPPRSARRRDVARMAAEESAFAASVPPDRRRRRRRRGRSDRRGAQPPLPRRPYAAAGIPPAIGFPMRDDIGFETVRLRVAIQAHSRSCALLVDRRATARCARVSFIGARRGSSRLRMDDADVGERRLGQTRATSPRASSRSRPSTSLNSTTRVVTARSIGGPRLPLRARTTSSSPSVAKVSSTVPWLAPVEDEDG